MKARNAKLLGLLIGDLLGGVVADAFYGSYFQYHGYLSNGPLVTTGILLGCFAGYRIGAYRSSRK